MCDRRWVLSGLGATAAGIAAWPARIGGAAAPSTVKTAVNFEIPRGACDCHVHIFDPTGHPYANNRVYTPPEASIADLLELQAALHLDRVVIVTPSVYGTDNSCTLDAMRRLGARARSVAVIDGSISAGALDAMAASGFRGVRLNVETAGESDPFVVKRLLGATAEQIRGRNWHIQLNTRLSVIAALHDDLAQLPFPVVLDHFGRAEAAAGTSQPGFDAMLDLLKSGRSQWQAGGGRCQARLSHRFLG